jgi:hypothetical protein
MNFWVQEFGGATAEMLTRPGNMAGAAIYVPSIPLILIVLVEVACGRHAENAAKFGVIKR